MKVLFLDIDGVVNCQKTFMTDKRQMYPLDKYMAFLVGRIVLETNCKVVLSSAWRNHPDGISAVEDSVVSIIDKTPNNRSGIRGNEIKSWLDKHQEVEKYAILDDDSDMLEEQIPNFFKTNWLTGLTDEIAQSVIEHLK